MTRTVLSVAMWLILTAYLPHPPRDTPEEDALWEFGSAELRLALEPWHEREFYAEKLRELGYQITAVNYDDPDYLEYEVVKGGQTYEVQIDIGADTGIATRVEVAPNLWRAEATEQALAATRQWEE